MVTPREWTARGNPLTTRARNCLASQNIEYLEDLTTWTEADVLRVPNFGFCCLIEIREALAARGLSLRHKTESSEVILSRLVGRVHERKASYEKALAELKALHFH